MHTDPCPEGVGGVASAALVKPLAAAIRNYVLLQRSVPVIVVQHATASPLAHRRETGRLFSKMT